MTAPQINTVAAPTDIPAAIAVLASSLHLPDIATAINLAVATGHPALLGAAYHGIDRIISAQPPGTPDEILALLTAAAALDRVPRGP